MSAFNTIDTRHQINDDQIPVIMAALGRIIAAHTYDTRHLVSQALEYADSLVTVSGFVPNSPAASISSAAFHLLSGPGPALYPVLSAELNDVILSLSLERKLMRLHLLATAAHLDGVWVAYTATPDDDDYHRRLMGPQHFFTSLDDVEQYYDDREVHAHHFDFDYVETHTDLPAFVRPNA